MEEFSKARGLGRIALSHWEKKFLVGKLEDYEISGDIYEIVQEANYGGALLRRQGYGPGPLYHFDVNSQYSAMMRSRLPGKVKAVGLVEGLLEVGGVMRKKFSSHQLKTVFGYVLATVAVEKPFTEVLGVLHARASPTKWAKRGGEEVRGLRRLTSGHPAYGVFRG